MDCILFSAIGSFLKSPLFRSLYNSRNPQTFTGKLLGGFCALSGVFILSLPIPIVVSSFANYYKNRLWRNEVAFKKEARRKQLKVTHCAYGIT